MDLNKLFTSAAVAANFIESTSNRVPYLGSGLFQPKKKAGLDLSWVLGANGLPVSLAPSTFDSKARFRDRIGVEKIETEMPFFREGYLIKEKDRQELLRAQSSSDPYAMAVIDRVFNDTQNLIEGANVVPERMIWQLLAPTNGNPGITISANGVDYTYNYDPNNTFKSSNYMALASNKWNNAASCDPIGDLMTAKGNIESKTGTVVTTAIMSRKTMNYLLKADSVKATVLTLNPNARVILTDQVVKDVIASVLGLNIIVYNKMYKNEAGTSAQFYPDDMVTLVPDGYLGSVWYGTTPEEADLMGSSDAEVSVVNTGVAVTRIVNTHPVNIELYASEIVLPSFERMMEVAVLKVV